MRGQPVSGGTRSPLLAVLVVGVLVLLLVPAAGARAASARTTEPPVLSARAGALYAPATGQFLYGVDAHRELPMASTTKLMTALVVLQHVHDLATVEAYPDYHQASDDSQIGLVPGERMTVHDLFIAMMLPSADDAAYDLAYHVGDGSIARFVAMMNAEARRLHLDDTHYTTPIGLDTPGNHSSAADLVRLAAYDMAHYPFFRHVVALRSATLATGPERNVSNLNDLVHEYPWIDGVKTGHTLGAGYVLVAAGRRGGLGLIAAELGAPTDAARDASALALLDYGYARYRSLTPVRAGQILARPAIAGRPGVRVPVRAQRAVTRVLPRSSDVRVTVEVPRQLTGPLPDGAVVGSATVLAGGRAVGRVPVVLERRLPAVSRLTRVAHAVTRPWVLTILIVGAIGLMVAGLRVAGRGRGRRPRVAEGSEWTGA